MTSYQRKFGWLLATITATALWTGCAPEFTDDVCSTNNDCFPNEVCLANTCVVSTGEQDVGNDTDDFSDVEDDRDIIDDNDTDDSDTQEPTRNACEGLDPLDNEPGEPCGPCNLDEFICDGTENTVCSGETACPEIALVTTLPTEITATGATLHGQIQSLSDDVPTDHGFCWSLEALPTDANGNCFSLGAVTADQEGSLFEHTIDELNPGTTYSVRAYHTDSTGTVYANTVEFTTLAPIPTNVTASQGTETAYVQLEWDEMPGATEYIVYRDDVLLDLVDADTTTFQDTTAEPAALTAPQMPTASQGDSYEAVLLSANPAAVTTSSASYAVRAVYPNAQSAHSEEATGYRGAGAISYQWERSASDSDQDFSPLAGATDLNTSDTTAPANGDVRYYRVVASAEGTESQTSVSVSGFRAETILPALQDLSVSSITTSSAVLVASIDTIGAPPATDHGFCWGTTTDPATDCIELGALPDPAPASFDHELEGLTAGTTYFVRAFLTVDATRYYSASETFQTTPLAPTNVTASSDQPGQVTLSWDAVTGANSYQIFRDGTSIASGLTTTSYNDSQADAAPPASAPSLSTSLSPTHVRLNWSTPTLTPGTEHAYTVVAVVNASQKSAPSTPVTGRRAAPAISHYEFQINSGAWQYIGLTNEYLHTGAPAPVITPGTATVTPGTLVGNTLTLSGHSVAHGEQLTYRVRAVTDQPGPASNLQGGGRIAGTLNIQWESASTPDGPFTAVLGANSATYTDSAPNGTYFRAAISSSGATTRYTNVVQSNP